MGGHLLPPIGGTEVNPCLTSLNGRLMRDEYETIPMFCPMCGGRLEQSERKE